MKIVLTNSCTCYNCTVDKKDINDFSIEEIKDVFKNVIDATMNENTLRQQLMSFIEQVGDCKYQYHCDQCGDDVYDYIMKL